jgi:hypothetical protein
MDEDIAKGPIAKVGDLVYCHACGNSHGWVLNQFGLVREVASYSDSGGPDMIRHYKVWLFKLNRIEVVRDKDFEEKNIELVSRASGDNEDLNEAALKWTAQFEDLVKAAKNRKMPFS